jgi:hypothetical protein
VRINRRAAGLAAVAVLSLGATACGTAEAGTTAAPPTVADTLLAAVPGTSAPAYTYAMKGGCTLQVTGVMDAPGSATQLKVTQKIPDLDATMTRTYLALGADDPYLRFAFEPSSLHGRTGVPKGWLALRPAKLPDIADGPFRYDGKVDPLGMGDMIRKASDLALDGTAFTGVVNLNSFEKIAAIIPAKTLGKLGDKATSVPIEGTLDKATGNLATLTIKVPSAKACTLSYSGYGKTKSLSAPKATKAPDVVYSLLD